jgi:hypothetical protein
MLWVCLVVLIVLIIDCWLLIIENCDHVHIRVLQDICVKLPSPKSSNLKVERLLIVMIILNFFIILIILIVDYWFLIFGCFWLFLTRLIFDYFWLLFWSSFGYCAYIWSISVCTREEGQFFILSVVNISTTQFIYPSLNQPNPKCLVPLMVWTLEILKKQDRLVRFQDCCKTGSC